MNAKTFTKCLALGILALATGCTSNRHTFQNEDGSVSALEQSTRFNWRNLQFETDHYWTPDAHTNQDRRDRGPRSERQSR